MSVNAEKDQRTRNYRIQPVIGFNQDQADQFRTITEMLAMKNWQ